MPSEEKDKQIQNFHGALGPLLAPLLEVETPALQDRHFSDQDGNMTAALSLPLHPTP